MLVGVDKRGVVGVGMHEEIEVGIDSSPPVDHDGACTDGIVQSGPCRTTVARAVKATTAVARAGICIPVGECEEAAGGPGRDIPDREIEPYRIPARASIDRPVDVSLSCGERTVLAS